MTDRLYRSPSDRIVAGVAGGMAVWLGVDPTLVRVAWVLLALASFGMVALVYIVMMIVTPLPPAGWVPSGRPSGAPGGAPGSGPIPGWGQGAGQPGGPAQDPPAGQQAPWGQGWPTGTPAGDPVAGISRNGGLIGGLVLIGLGAWFLVDRYIHIDMALVWPVVIMALGGLLIAGALRRKDG